MREMTYYLTANIQPEITLPHSAAETEQQLQAQRIMPTSQTEQLSHGKREEFDSQRRESRYNDTA